MVSNPLHSESKKSHPQIICTVPPKSCVLYAVAVRTDRFEKTDDEYGAETFEVRLYFRRLVHPGDAPLGVVIDATYNEILLLPVEQREVHYDYSDADDFGQVVVPACSLEEIAAEKLRGLLFQRVNPSPRMPTTCGISGPKGR